MLRCFAFSQFLLLCANFSSFGTDDYKLGPDSMPQQGVSAGQVEGPLLFKSQGFTNTRREYWRQLRRSDIFVETARTKNRQAP